jgi:hypothetical protein
LVLPLAGLNGLIARFSASGGWSLLKPAMLLHCRHSQYNDSLASSEAADGGS